MVEVDTLGVAKAYYFSTFGGYAWQGWIANPVTIAISVGKCITSFEKRTMGGYTVVIRNCCHLE